LINIFYIKNKRRKKTMKIWETIKLGRGKLQLYTSRCFTLTDEDGNIEYYGIKNSAKY